MTVLIVLGIVALAASTFLLLNPTERPHTRMRVVAGLVAVASFALVMWSSGQYETHHHTQPHTVKEVTV